MNDTYCLIANKNERRAVDMKTKPNMKGKYLNVEA